MTKALYMMGPPGVGKSTVMGLLLDLLGLETGPEYRVWPTRNKQLHGQDLEDIVTGQVRGLYLGVQREDFPGTDGLGMAASTEAVEWVNDAETLPELVLGEGQRLGTFRFLKPLSERADLRVVYLNAETRILDARCAERGSNQSDQFRRAAATRAKNVTDELRSAGVKVVEFDAGHRPAERIARDLKTYSLVL
jgi:hypothetical protein